MCRQRSVFRYNPDNAAVFARLGTCLLVVWEIRGFMDGVSRETRSDGEAAKGNGFLLMPWCRLEINCVRPMQ